MQAVLKHLGHFGNEAVVVDEAELQCFQQLQNLYNSTREAKVKMNYFFTSISSIVMQQLLICQLWFILSSAILKQYYIVR